MPLNCFYLVAKILNLEIWKKNSIWERPCVDYWPTLTALLPTWGSQWFVSGMAELLSGRRAYVTGAADNTWVLSWGLGEWPGSLRETERSPQPTASALGGLRGSIYCWDWGHKLVLLALRSFMKETFLYSSCGTQALTFEMLPTFTPGETAEHSHCLLLRPMSRAGWWWTERQVQTTVIWLS